MKRFNLIAIVLFLVAVGGLFALGPGGTQKIQSSFLGLISPFLKTGSSIDKRVKAIREGLKHLNQLEAENEQLRIQNKRLGVENSALGDLQRENLQLRKALHYRERANFSLVPARIISRDSTTWWNTVRIDRGFEDGIESDMPVVTEEGLVGKTTTVARNMTTVLLISDENCKAAARIEGSREQGIVSGERESTTGSPRLGMRVLSKTAELQRGQKVYTSGVGGVYPPDVFIGAVEEFKVRELDSYATIIPAVNLGTLEDVFVVIGRK